MRDAIGVNTVNLRANLPVNLRAAALLALFAIVGAESSHSQGRQIYPAPEQASADIAAALKDAAAQHRRVILDFGGDWCTDCQVLDIYFHDSNNKPILEANFILVHINVGHRDQNVSLADRYQTPLDKGVPALAVLNMRGKVLYSQKGGEFEPMRHMESSAVTQFLTQWKPATPAQPPR